MPKSPRGYVDLHRIGHGAMFEGSKGVRISDFGSRILLPSGDDADMTYYKPRPKEEQEPKIDHFIGEWINACKGDLKTACDFDYGSKIAEQMMLGLVAYRAGKKLEYDGASGRVTNCPEANELLKRTYRKGWTLNG